MIKKLLAFIIIAFQSLVLYSQGGNTGYGGDEQTEFVSLTERVLKIEKKHDAFNLYLNFSGAGGVEVGGGDRKTGFNCKQLRLEIKGNLTSRLYYRLRHRLNKANYAAGEDNFAKATDYMMVGYRFNDHWTVQAGKMCQYWGGYEFDANPMYIYRYSDMIDNIDSPKAGLVVMYKPIASQEFIVEASNSRNESLETSFPGISAQGIKDTRAPLAYIFNWNGNFAKNKVQTRWSWGLRTLAEDTYSRQMVIGQRLNLPKFQCYIDYSYENDDIDRMGIITREVKHLLPKDYSYFEKVDYHSIVAKADWQFANKWNAYVQGMYETASVRKDIPELKNYRKHCSYFAGVEYYPDKSQDLRVSLSYLGQTYSYTGKCGLNGHNESRIELGLMYRIKCF
ncbi:MAG: porin [Bacteroidales bacterium]|nr:porin [Bacteroidales bacterium]MDD6668997.1 porin [Bacteroidales bacterium]